MGWKSPIDYDGLLRKFLAGWAEKVGLGFEIPMTDISEPGLIALRALQNQESIVAA